MICIILKIVGFLNTLPRTCVYCLANHWHSVILFLLFFCVNEIISHDLISNWIILVLEEFYTILSNVKHLATNLCTYSKPFTFNYSCSPFIHKGQARQEPQSFWREKKWKHTVFPHIVATATILFWNCKTLKNSYSFRINFSLM